MNTNESKINIKRIIFIIFLSIWTIALIVYYIQKNQTISYAVSYNETDTTETLQEDVQISDAEKIDIEKIIEANTAQNYREEIVTEETDLEYTTQYKENSELPSETLQVIQEGRLGIQEVVIKKIYDGDELISEEEISSEVKKKAVTKIIEIGTGNFKSKYSPEIGDTLYVTSDRLNVMAQNSDSSRKVTSLNKNDELKILEISDDWYYISSGNIKGWVKSESTTYIDPNQTYEEQFGSDGITKEEALKSLSMNMDLTQPSGLSLEQFKEVLTDSKDTNNVFANNAEYFYYAEQQYGINGIFLAAIGIHESAWGTSKISLNKKNLFGYGAYDSSPSSSAYSFSDYSEGIDMVARVLVKYYLNPAGTSIYNGETASGKYYSGNTISAVNSKYATDTNWKNCVYQYMKYLYNKI
jgi:beta-N-acetylglucosaminidase